MTDNEITVQALKKLLEVVLNEGDLQRASTISHAIDLINRLQSENEWLCAEIDELIIAKDLMFDEAEALIKRAKSEARKEFAERVKEEVKHIPWCDYPPVHEKIDNILMESDDK